MVEIINLISTEAAATDDDAACQLSS